VHTQDAGALTVGQVAKLAGVTIRTLHHYEHIGLLRPGARTDAGYRLYTWADIDRLSRILYYRALGFPLDGIAALLDDPSLDAWEHLQRQRDLLAAQSRKLHAMLAAVEREMEALMAGYNLTPEEKLEVFGDVDPDQYADEARERWGDTDAWAQSRRRTAAYTKDDWLRIQAEASDLNARFVELMQAGASATGVDAMTLAEEHRRHITRWFYDCGYDIHRGLAEMYVADARFTENIDQAAPGLAVYMREAILANAERRETRK
jgi:DNA-binding transcriptional MerR regulator